MHRLSGLTQIQAGGYYRNSQSHVPVTSLACFVFMSQLFYMTRNDNECFVDSSVTKTKGAHLISYCTRAAKPSSTTARHLHSLSRLSEEAQIRCEIGLSQNRQSKITLLLLRAFPYLGSSHRVFNLHILRSCASSIFTPFSFMSFHITSLHLSFCLHIFRCAPTSILQVTCSPSAVFLSTCPNHLSLASLIF